jgi:hypothetical protein
VIYPANPYISATIGVAIISTALIISPSVPGELHPILGSAYFALSSAMACRVFRAVLLGTIKVPQVTTARISSLVHVATNSDDDYDTSYRLSKLNINVAVEMDTRMESFDGHTFWERGSMGNDVQKDASHNV